MDAKEIVKKMLDERAIADALFAETYAKPNKSIDGCWKYIESQARKKADHGCCAVADSEVLSWAVHYYDEDDIEEPKVDAPARVTTASDLSKEALPKVAPVQPKPTKKKRVEDDLQLSLF